jgi:UDP:flavonoid glycosyltransferase YjiC (YdhE family)
VTYATPNNFAAQVSLELLARATRLRPQTIIKIVFTTVRAPGHLNSTTTLARRLKARGHDVVFLAVSDAEPFVNAARLPFIPYGERDYPAVRYHHAPERGSKRWLFR